MTQRRHFRAGGGEAAGANSMLLQPYRKPAWLSCQPAAIYGPWGQREGEEGRERKTPPSTPPPAKIDRELFLDAYSSHTFLCKSQDMGSVQKLFSKRQLLTPEDELGAPVSTGLTGGGGRVGRPSGTSLYLTAKIPQNLEGRVRRLQRRFSVRIPKFKSLPPSVFCYTAWGRSLGKSNETLGSELRSGADLRKSLHLSLPQFPHLQNAASQCTS